MLLIVKKHLQDICDVMNVFNETSNHFVDFSKGKIAWFENFNIFKKLCPPPIYEYHKAGSLCFNGSEITKDDKKRFKGKCLGWDLKFID